jgi:hypothetical protein
VKDVVKISIIQMATKQAIYDPEVKNINVEKIIKYLEEEGTLGHFGRRKKQCGSQETGRNHP